MIEVWKTFKETKRVKWEISNFGRVKKNNKIYQPKINKTNNYYFFGGYYLHRVVAELFVENTFNKQCVDHIDTNRLNNHVDNLRWVTYKENSNNPETIKKLSNSLKSININHKGENNPRYGKHLSEDTKRTIGIKQSISWKNKSLEEKKLIIEKRADIAKGRIWINNGKENKFIRKEDYKFYDNYVRGRISKKCN